ncbi:hypothetical protein WJX74_002063 [Apatococcus lobatus]|uniref:glutathione transferase n=1 Tax=Apatococcus lobatus TaxID=904363 RepID=A0AAW1QCV0_9CHLO
MTSTPTIYYFKVKARAEPLKVALSVRGIAYHVETISNEQAKNLEDYPFGQAPRYKDESVDLVQTNAILRHIGRKHDLYGSSLEQQAHIDVLVEGVQDILLKTFMAVVIKKDEESKSEFWAAHGDPSSKEGKTGGAHFSYLDAFIKKSQGSYAVGNTFTIADAALFCFLDIAQPALADKLSSTYPDLLAYYKQIAGLPAVQRYLSSD